MKFIEISKARGLEIDTPVFTLDKDGKYGLGKLIKVELTKEGKQHTFEQATFTIEGQPPAIKPTLSTNIISVCVIKA